MSEIQIREGAKVLLMMGSDSDFKYFESSIKLLDGFHISYDLYISSAHRTPERTEQLVKAANAAGVQVFIVGAGLAAHLAGVVASHTTRPVIGVPLDVGPFAGQDSLLAMVQMPPGIPVATVTVGKAGAKNAALLAVQMLALQDDALHEKFKAYRESMKETVAQKSDKIRRKVFEDRDDG